MQIWIQDSKRRPVKRQYVIKYQLHCTYNYFMDIQKRKILPLNGMARVVLRKGCELASGPQKMTLLQINSWGWGQGCSRLEERRDQKRYSFRKWWENMICKKVWWEIGLEDPEGSTQGQLALECSTFNIEDSQAFVLKLSFTEDVKCSVWRYTHWFCAFCPSSTSLMLYTVTNPLSENKVWPRFQSKLIH